MILIGVLGAKGYVGKAIVKALYNLYDMDKKVKPEESIGIVQITRENYAKAKEESYSIIINSAMPSGRHWAELNPQDDFRETVQLTSDLIYGWHYNKFIQISTLSARTEPNLIYGRHKALAEKICEHAYKPLILRLTAMYSEDMSKGALVDILNDKPVYASELSRYAFISRDYVGQWVANNLKRTGVVELGAKNTISLKEISKYLGKDSHFSGLTQLQEILEPEENFPDANEVLKFMDYMEEQRSLSNGTKN